MCRCPFCETGLCLGGGLVWRLSSVLVGRGSDGLAAYKYDTIRYFVVVCTTSQPFRGRNIENAFAQTQFPRKKEIAIQHM